jgi:hypothetical protein
MAFCKDWSDANPRKQRLTLWSFTDDQAAIQHLPTLRSGPGECTAVPVISHTLSPSVSHSAALVCPVCLFSFPHRSVFHFVLVGLFSFLRLLSIFCFPLCFSFLFFSPSTSLLFSSARILFVFPSASLLFSTAAKDCRKTRGKLCLPVMLF